MMNQPGLAGTSPTAVSSSRASGAILLAHQLLERLLVADRIEVRIVGCERAKLLRAVDREPQVRDRVVGPTDPGLAARDGVGQLGVRRMSLDQLAPAVGDLGVLARLVERAQRLPQVVGFDRGRQADPRVPS